ncbi:hypothetical protein F5Y10DRAFT_253034 [Nemania abortiva]|nr:hypothetical protein F5Y10DRAFT_253034 [Nemania abortiva]
METVFEGLLLAGLRAVARLLSEGWHRQVLSCVRAVGGTSGRVSKERRLGRAFPELKRVGVVEQLRTLATPTDGQAEFSHAEKASGVFFNPFRKTR